MRTKTTIHRLSMDLSERLGIAFLVEMQRFFRTSSLGVGRLLQILIACPQLRNLTLDLCMPRPPDQLYNAVHLPALAWVRLGDPVHSCEALLNHLRFPPKTSIEIYPLGVRNGVDIRRLLVPTRKHIREPGARRPLLLQIDRQGNSYYTVSLFCRCDSDPRPPNLYNLGFMGYPLALHFNPKAERAFCQIITKVLHAFPPDSITQLDARIGPDIQEVSWRALLTLLPSLETVYLTMDATALNCVEALTLIEVQDCDRTSSRIRCLHILVSRHVNEVGVAFLTALERYIRRCASSPDSLVFDDSQYCLAVQEERLDRFFALMGGEILWNNSVYPSRLRYKKRGGRRTALE
ncbi:hypothetical protein C8R47DRAFT_7642 [Mycena vitilis]|nr:hypothetical protein C8R47DRAFT_7642 [Mycena vitilis]